MASVDGPSCGKCHLSEALCARTYPCCERCTHTFGHGDETEIISKPEKRVYQHTDPNVRTVLPDPYAGAWYVATSGRAHLWTDPTYEIAKCGRVRAAPIGESVTSWYDHCLSCEQRNDREWEGEEVQAQVSSR